MLAAIVAATWLTWASLRHGFDLRWWSVLSPLLPAGIVAGFIWRVFTTRVGGEGRLELVPDLDVYLENAMCSCNASDDNPY